MTRFGAKSSNDTIEASESNPGILEIATQAETNTGTDDVRAVTPAKLANYSGLGGGGAGVAVEEDGSEEGTGIDRFDFTTGLNVAVSGTQATISAAGGGGSGNISGAYDIEANTSYTDAGMSDEFDTDTLDAQWTVLSVNGATATTGTANPFVLQGTPGIYDLTTRAKGILLQPRSNQTTPLEGIIFRQADALASGESIVMSTVLPDSNHTPTASGVLIEMLFGVNSTFGDTGFLQFHVIRNDTTFILLATNTGTTIGTVNFGIAETGRRIYMRVSRVSNDYWFLYSFDGIAWSFVGRSASNSTTYTHTFVRAQAQQNSTYSPVFPVNWIRHVASTAYDLW
jgi:hypothetical protein